MQRKGEHAGCRGEERADHDALEDDAGAVELAEVLQEDHDLEALAVDRCEAEQREPEQHSPLVGI